MKVAVGSAFRNMAGYPLDVYTRRLAMLRDTLAKQDHHLRWIAVEGDSIDATKRDIRRYAESRCIATELVERNHGGPWFGSVETAERMRALSFVGNGILESVRPDDDVLVYIESDLVWESDTIMRLIEQLRPGFDVVAPLIFAGEAFYDIWAYRKNGQRFSPFKPYHPDVNGEPVAIDSAGSCLVMRAEVARRCRIVEDMCLVGFCKDVWDKGFTLHVDPRERIYHP